MKYHHYIKQACYNWLKLNNNRRGFYSFARQLACDIMIKFDDDRYIYWKKCDGNDYPYAHYNFIRSLKNLTNKMLEEQIITN